VGRGLSRTSLTPELATIGGPEGESMGPPAMCVTYLLYAAEIRNFECHSLTEHAVVDKRKVMGDDCT
jgi:hypothetical protein